MTVAMMSNGNSRRNKPFAIGMGAIKAVTPNIKPMLAIFDPSALPIAISGVSSKTAMMDTRISGADVPNPITAMPIMRGEIPK
jgi:hypothetical protein